MLIGASNGAKIEVITKKYGAIREITVYDDVEDLVAANEYVIYKINAYDGYEEG